MSEPSIPVERSAQVPEKVQLLDLRGSLVDRGDARVPDPLLDRVGVVDAEPAVHLRDFVRRADAEAGGAQFRDRRLGGTTLSRVEKVCRPPEHLAGYSSLRNKGLRVEAGYAISG